MVGKGEEWRAGYTYWMWLKQERFLHCVTVLTLSFILLIVWLVSAGYFDPKPVGSLRWQKSLPPQTVVAGPAQIMWLEVVKTADYSVRTTVMYQSGEKDIIYGLALGSESDYLVVAVSPLGYVSLWQGGTVIMPLQTWPHVHMDSAPNEIWVNVEQAQLTVHLNREILWTGDSSVGSGIGVMGQSWGETGVIHIPSVQLFTP